MREIKVYKDADELASSAASQIAYVLNQAIERTGTATLALAGGSTPERTYRELAACPIEWSRVLVFFSDERFVPHDDVASNFGMARRSLLDPAKVPPANIFPVGTSAETPEAAAIQYDRMLLDSFRGPPTFDLVLLGLGQDGHTASLFPEAAALDVADRWVVSSPPGTLPPPVDRITFTFRTINSASQVMFLVAGEGKARALKLAIDEEPNCRRCPASCIRPVAGQLMWLLDESAATFLDG